MDRENGRDSSRKRKLIPEDERKDQMKKAVIERNEDNSSISAFSSDEEIDKSCDNFATNANEPQNYSSQEREAQNW